MNEAILQQTTVKMITEFYPEFLIILSLSGTQLNGTPQQKAKILNTWKEQGFRKGLPDFTLCLPEGRVIHIELKTPNGTGVQSKDQKEVETKLIYLDHKYYLCNSTQCVFDAINKNLPLDYSKRRLDKLLKEIPQDDNISKESFLMFSARTPIDIIKESIQQYF